MKTKQLFLLALFFTSIFSAQSQENTDILKYLDDGGIAASKYTLKLNLTSIYEGNIQPSIEFKLSDSFALEAGAGLLLPKYRDPFFYDMLSKDDPTEISLNKPNTGLSIIVNPRYYYNEQHAGFYWSFPVQYRLYPSQIHLFDASLNAGFQWTWDNGLVLDITAGIGGTWQETIDDKSFAYDASSKTNVDYEAHNIYGIENTEPDKFRIMFPIAVKVGYKFRSR